MPIKIGGTELSHINIDSDGVGLVLVGNKAVFADFSNGKDAASFSNDLTFSNTITSNYTKQLTFTNVYDMNMVISSLQHSSASASNVVGQVSMRYFYDNNNNYFEMLFTFNTGPAGVLNEWYSIEFSNHENGQINNTKYYEFDEDGEEISIGYDLVGAKHGIKLTNDLMPLRYVQKSGATSMSYWGGLRTDALNNAVTYKDNRPRVEVWVRKDSGFQDNCLMTFNTSIYQHLTNH